MLKTWRDFKHCKVPVVRARVEEIVRRASGPRVLEVGCNEGWVAKAIQEERGFDVVAVDNRDEAILLAKTFFNIDVVKADVLALPFADASFDCVIGAELLEHLNNPGAGLSEIFRVSKGHVILTLPIGKYWNDEKTHAWQMNGSVIEHDHACSGIYFKHCLVMEFRKIRELGLDGNYRDVAGHWEDR